MQIIIAPQKLDSKYKFHDKLKRQKNFSFSFSHHFESFFERVPKDETILSIFK